MPAQQKITTMGNTGQVTCWENTVKSVSWRLMANFDNTYKSLFNTKTIRREK